MQAIKRLTIISAILIPLLLAGMAFLVINPYGWFRAELPRPEIPDTPVIMYKQDILVDGKYSYREIDSQQLELIDIEDASGDVDIPNSIHGASVVALANGFLSCNDDLTSVSIPGSVKEIGPFAFLNCQYLETIKLNKGLETIGTNAFQGCVRLKKLNFPESIRTIKDGAFGSCKSCSLIIFNSKVPLTIGTAAFRDTAVSTITFPSSTVEIGRYAFSCCSKLKTINVNQAAKTYSTTFAKGRVAPMPGLQIDYSKDEYEETTRRPDTTRKTTTGSPSSEESNSSLTTTDPITNTEPSQEPTQEPTTTYHFWWDVFGILD